jgi:hypothetical protein
VARDLTIRILAKDEASQTFKQVDGAISGLETHAQDTGKAVVAWDAAMRGAEQTGRNLADFLKSSVTAFAEDEASIVRMTQALQNQGNATPAVIKQYEDLATQFQKTTTVSDDAVRSIIATLVQIGNVGPDQMQEALTAVLNLSAGLNIDLNTAAKAVAKSFNEGGAAALTRLLPGLRGIVKDGAPTAEILRQINEHFSDQATSRLKTYSGQVENLNNRWNDFQERAGGLIANVLTPLLNLLEQLPDPLQAVVFGFAELAKIVAPLGVGIAAIVMSMGGWAALWGGVTAAVSGLMGVLASLLPYLGPAGIIAAGVGSWIYVFKNLDVIVWAVQQVYEGVKHWLVDMFQTGIVAPLKAEIDTIIGAFTWMKDQVVSHSIVPDMVNEIGAETERLQNVMVGPVQTTTQAVQGAFSTMATNVIATYASLGAAAAGAAEMVRNAYEKAGFIVHPIISAQPGRPPGMAAGGPVSAGSPYLVGERGPELFVPSTSGTVVPNAGAMTFNITIGRVDSERTARRYADETAQRIFARLNQHRAATLGKA